MGWDGMFISIEVVWQPERIGKNTKFKSVLATMVAGSLKKLGAALLSLAMIWPKHSYIFIYLLPTGSTYRH
jgi:hypothetical protein